MSKEDEEKNEKEKAENNASTSEAEHLPEEKKTDIDDSFVDEENTEEVSSDEEDSKTETAEESSEDKEEIKEETKEEEKGPEPQAKDSVAAKHASKDIEKKSPLKIIATIAFFLLLLGGFAIAIPNSLWYYALQTGSKNMEALEMQQATRDFETAVNIAHYFPESDERLAISLNTLSTVLLAQGRYKEAEKTIEESLKVHEKRYGDDARATKPLLLMAGLNKRQGKYEKAAKLYELALEKISKSEGEKEAYATALNYLSVLDIYRGNYDKAEKGFNKVEEIRKSLMGKEYGVSVDFLINKGRLEEARGNYHSAKQLYRKCLRELGPVNDSNKASRCLVLNLMAEIFLTENNNDEAGPLIQKAHALSQSLSAREYLQAANLETLTNLATLHITEGKFDKAEKILAQSIPIARDRLGEGHPAYAKVQMQEAEVLASKGKFKEARAVSDRAEAIIKETVGDEHRFVAEKLRSQAKILAFANKKDESEARYKEALEMFRRCLGKSHPECAETMFGYAALLEANGNSAKANDLQYRARKIVEAANNR